jgi:hypothetical protein
MSRFLDGNIEAESANRGEGTRLDFFNVMHDEVRTSGDSQRAEISSGLFASQRQREPYPGYYDRVAKEREQLDDRLTCLFDPMEKAAGFVIGAYGIYGSLVKSRRKWLEPPNWLVKPLPTTAEIKELSKLSVQLKGLASGQTVAAASLVHQARAIETQVLGRSRLLSFGGLAIGLGVSQLTDRMFFKHDELGDGSAFADLVAAPLLAWRMPGNLLTKAAAVVVVELAGKTVDHFRQPQHLCDPRLENRANVPAKSDSFLSGPHLTAPPNAMFWSEDIQNQKLNRARQRREIDAEKRLEE